MAESVVTSLEPRPFQALLNGLIKKNFYSEASITVDYLIQQLYEGSELDSAQIVHEISVFEQILRRAAERNWDSSIVCEFLNKRSLAEEYVSVFNAVWQKESGKIHTKLIKDVRWNNSLDRFSWRVDVRAISKTCSEINEPIAFFEIATTNQQKNISVSSNTSKSSVVPTAKFEMSRDEVAAIQAELAAIQRVFDEAV